MIKNNFFAGLKTILPIILLIIILSWVIGGLSSGIEFIESLFPNSVLDVIGLPDVVIKLIWVLLFCVMVWIIGIISKQPRMSKKFKKWLGPVITRIPLLSHLYSITNQVAILQKNSGSFKSVVLVPLLENRAWTVGFITTNKSLFSNYFPTPDEMVSVFMPMTPLTSGLPVTMSRKDIIETNVSVADAIAYIATAGIAGATEKILKESHSDSE
jgi:uncharacterized membrane protein